MKTTPTKPTIQALHTAALTGLISLALLSPAVAADFSGSLRGVTITDAQATNKPPVAAFTYKKEGETIVFDASSSSDTDGSIIKYKWDFGNGTISEGAITTYTLTNTANLQVTLAVVDNNNSVSLIQQDINPKENIYDDFSSDTSANYISISNALSVSGDKATCTAWSNASVYHKTNTGTNNNYAQADVTFSNSNEYAGVIARWNPTNKTGYSVRLSGSSLRLYAQNGTNIVLLSGYNATFPTGTKYTVKIIADGSTIKGYVNDIERVSATNTLYSFGEYAGINVSRAYGGTTSIDNFIGGGL